MFDWNSLNINLVFLLLVIWEMYWKAIGLWRAAKRGEKVWFFAIFLINFFGIVPIVYLWRTKQLNEVLTETKTFFRSRFKK